MNSNICCLPRLQEGEEKDGGEMSVNGCALKNLSHIMF